MYTVKEVADTLRVNQMTVFRALNKRKIAGIKIGTTWRISEEELERIKREGF